MNAHHQSENVTLLHGDCIDVMRTLPDNSVDSIVTDPPYGLGFMGKEWDALPPGKEWAEECLRVLKPGGHLLAFGGTRTWHRLAVAVEDAGFEIRDSLAWLYGSGFPKSMDVSKAIDKAAGAEREVTGTQADRWTGKGSVLNFATDRAQEEINTYGAPATDAARQWEGWGTALKPAFEPVVMGRKPFKGTVAANVLEHGTGALNIDASRITPTDPEAYAAKGASVVGLDSNRNGAAYGEWSGVRTDSTSSVGRFPANVILEESQAEVLDEQSGFSKSAAGAKQTPKKGTAALGDFMGTDKIVGHNDSGGASRFFYVAKAPRSERPVVDGLAHSTVKPLTLMRYLVKLVTPPGGTVLEPFAGSGTTAEACVLEGFNCIAIEREAEYLPLIEVRIDRALAQIGAAA